MEPKLKEKYLDIAKIIDNEYIGKDHTTKIIDKGDYVYLTTNVCDWAMQMMIYKSLKLFYVLDEEGWREVTQPTYDRVNKYLNMQS